ncbi:hypothetical protein K461DRAFT_281768 [Myriangium duriaei CBS 260.36]|uniref:Tudor domain-containing protein n=1 Tax=Myriangium duriaei CBS 260.36 TaxID=1168546 RepID=A0A9P4MDZ2_9PEZI|nr:hypothetical protein K461DRAFT_281768 [Myriangium duriaei CBS 260.36]
MPTLAELEAELETQNGMLKEMDEILELMPDSQDAIDAKAACEALKKDIVGQIAALKGSSPAPPPPPPATATVSDTTNTTGEETGGYSHKHNEERRVFKVNEHVSARYSGDRQFYPATIISVMGSSAAPIYTVKFKGYDGAETVRAHDIRPTSYPSSATAQKRKADTTTSTSSPALSSTPYPPPPPPSNGSVLSAPPAIDSALAESLRKDSSATATSDDPDAEKKPKKKIKTNKSLDKAKANWQSWQQKASSGSGKLAKSTNKDSMFRTGDKPGAKVGFTGSGQSMRKDAERTRHTYYMPPGDSSRY